MRRSYPLLLLLFACAPDAPGGEADPGTAPVSDAVPMPDATLVAESQQASWEEALDVVIGDADAWVGAWGHFHDGVSPLPTLPVVDFATQRVVIVTAGVRPSGGHGLRHTGLSVRGDTLVLAVTFTVPAAECSVTMALTAPAIAVTVPRTPDTVVVERTTEVTSCT